MTLAVSYFFCKCGRNLLINDGPIEKKLNQIHRLVYFKEYIFIESGGIIGKEGDTTLFPF